MKKPYLFAPIYALIFLVVSITSGHAQSNIKSGDKESSSDDLTKTEKINSLVSTFANYGQFEGAVLVVEKGKIIYKNGFGMANHEWDMPIQTDTKFRIASVTKQFTAMLIMQLVAENKLALDMPLSKYLPNYPQENADKITIHHLLTHSSGIPNYTSFPSYRDLMREYKTPMEIIDIFADSTLQFTPGERFDYSNSGYVLLGAIIEEVTGKTYGKVLQEMIFKPLKMINSGFDNNRKILKNRAVGYNKIGASFENASPIDMSMAYSAGGIYSTVEDMYLWDQALYTSALIPKSDMDLVFQKHIPAWGQHYGYGWMIGDISKGNSDERIATIEHDGVINGFTSSIIRIPSERSSIIILNNTGGGPLRRMSQAICGILYGKSFDLPKQSVAYSMLDVIRKEGMQKGKMHFEAVKDKSDFYLSEREINMASYDLLSTDNAEEAVEVLKLGISAYPNAFNLYDSYGEVLRTLGKKEEAVKNYTKSVKLNPKNENGLRMLKELGVDIEKEDLYLVKTDKSWTKEIFTFPLHFASDLKFQGREEAHFPKGWRKLDSPEFWSYTFAWTIDLNEELTEDIVESHMQSYFDGLLNVVNKNKDFVLPKTIAKIKKYKGSIDNSKFSGTLEIFDTFVTNEPMTLNVLAENFYCKQEEKMIILYKFSPKALNHEIWTVLDKIALRDNKCTH